MSVGPEPPRRDIPPPRSSRAKRLHGDEARSREEIAAEAVDEEVTSRPEAFVAILIVLATLAAAVVGYLQVWSSGRSDSAATQAQRDAVVATAQQVRTDRWSDVQISTLTTSALFSEQANQRDAQQQVFGPRETTAERLADDRLHAQALRFADLSRLVGDTITKTGISGVLAPEGDPAFPTRFENVVARDPIRLRALQDQSNTEGSGWSTRGAAYTAILTLFAVALYLLGFSFALPIALGRWFVRGGVAFLVAGVAWAVIASVGRPQGPSDEAAAAFASGTIALENSADAYDPSQHEDAVRYLSRAIEARPDFARAYLSRGEASYSANSSTLGVSTVTSAVALRHAISDLKRAIQLGLDNAEAIGDVGALSFQEAMVENQPDLLVQARQFTQRAIGIDPERPLWLYNLAMTELALGQSSEAMSMYRKADAATRNDASTAATWTSGALSELDVLAQHRPSATRAVLAAKELIVGDVFGRGVSRAPAPSALQIELVVTPSLVQFTIPSGSPGGIDPRRDVVVAEWYYNDLMGHGFAILPEVSSRVALTPTGDGGWFNLQQYLPARDPPHCLAGGTYRVELYINGHLVGEKSTVREFGDQETVTDDGLNAGFCVPGDWVQSPKTTLGVIQAWTSPDASQGLTIIKAPLSVFATSAKLPGILDSAVRKFASALSPPLTGPGPPHHFFFLGLAPQLEETYRYKGGMIRAGVGLDEGEGAVVIAIAFSPSHDSGTAAQAFDSLTSLQQNRSE
jgi:tetratricopeptide (TPR) repeat protein